MPWILAIEQSPWSKKLNHISVVKQDVYFQRELSWRSKFIENMYYNDPEKSARHSLDVKKSIFNIPTLLQEKHLYN